jgi:hypothetical protein
LERSDGEKIPEFFIWKSVLNLELICLRFVRSIREANFVLYIDVLKELLPWMFALDHTNYSRWLSVRYRDMHALRLTNPDVFKNFKDGAFVVNKSTRAFSAIALDHAHEQENTAIKRRGRSCWAHRKPCGTQTMDDRWPRALANGERI